RSNVPAHIVKFCFPPMGGAGSGSMHSKLQLLKYKNSLRIAIPTGNLTRYDWGETGVMENVGTVRLCCCGNATNRVCRRPFSSLIYHVLWMGQSPNPRHSARS